ncbi:Intracellular septation protein A [Candidatus Ruthia magnifica str. Cm (Calyptogena magnifica)]|uniref:Inner membrane-spanning protein YciB n=1 Tax=Ruthia magnifica subsp. Calyptogena magnifica TaxID=413404 RepID=A1AXI1_RUTMC|nr:inner membrane-spanning protein YciB [Candidatus Ruthturnera calyptogenae]ABL02638.1 Intracellular septation protein A [Candidatus Ruthia magnifica str. Cm (Calyptogena magnifica)]
MKFLLDFFPIVLFFVIYRTMGLYMAIYAMIGATFLQIMITRYRMGKFENIHLITFGLLVFLGGITLALRDPAFLMWKVSVLYVVFAFVLVLSMWIGKKTLLQRMLGKELELPKNMWHQLSWLWGFGFTSIAIFNAHYVNLALGAREALFTATKLDSKIELTELDCVNTTMEQLCIVAQHTEESWVDFKLFGTMGLTFTLIIITIIFIKKYIKEDKK